MTTSVARLKPLPTMHFEGKVVLRHELPDRMKVTWTKTNINLFLAAVSHGLMSEQDLQKEYGVSSEGLRKRDPVVPRPRTTPRAPHERRVVERVTFVTGLPETDILASEGIEIDLQLYLVHIDGVLVHFPRRLFIGLAQLMNKRGEVVRREEFLRARGYAKINQETLKTVEVAINSIRNILGEKYSGCVVTEPKLGYRWGKPVIQKPQSSD